MLCCRTFNVDEMSTGANELLTSGARLNEVRTYVRRRRTLGVVFLLLYVLCVCTWYICLHIQPTLDPICAACVSDKKLLIARTSGTLQCYSLPKMMFENKYFLNCRPAALDINSDSTYVRTGLPVLRIRMFMNVCIPSTGICSVLHPLYPTYVCTYLRLCAKALWNLW